MIVLRLNAYPSANIFREAKLIATGKEELFSHRAAFPADCRF
jgi:hypothetical protein